MLQKPTGDEIAQYNREGYIVLNRPIFPQDQFAQMKAYCEEKLIAASKFGPGPALVDCPHWTDPKMFDFLLADEMLSIVEPLIGPDIGIFACHLLQKPAGVGKRVPWHEDSAYWKNVLDPMEVASVTIALEPSIPANGCLRVIPGSHRHGYSDYAPVDRPDEQVFHTEILKEQMDESRAVDIALQPNEASVHHVQIIHGSNPNTGSMRRSVLTVRYFPTTVKFKKADHEVFSKVPFHIYLARGKDRAGNVYSDPTKSYGRNEKVSTV